MRNMAVLHSPAFSYPLPVLVRVLFNLLIFKGKILYYNKYSNFKGFGKHFAPTNTLHICRGETTSGLREAGTGRYYSDITSSEYPSCPKQSSAPRQWGLPLPSPENLR